MAVLRQVVTEEGGHVLDLHVALKRHEFRDELGHLSEEGIEKMSRLVEPEVERLLRKNKAVLRKVRKKRRSR